MGLIVLFVRFVATQTTQAFQEFPGDNNYDDAYAFGLIVGGLLVITILFVAYLTTLALGVVRRMSRNNIAKEKAPE